MGRILSQQQDKWLINCLRFFFLIKRHENVNLSPFFPACSIFVSIRPFQLSFIPCWWPLSERHHITNWVLSRDWGTHIHSRKRKDTVCRAPGRSLWMGARKGTPQNGCEVDGTPQGCVQQPDLLCSYCKRAGSWRPVWQATQHLGNLTGTPSLSHWDLNQSPKHSEQLGVPVLSFLPTLPPPSYWEPPNQKPTGFCLCWEGPRPGSSQRTNQGCLVGERSSILFSLRTGRSGFFQREALCVRDKRWKQTSSAVPLYLLIFILCVNKNYRIKKIKSALLDGWPGSCHLFWLHYIFTVIDGVPSGTQASVILGENFFFFQNEIFK